jgi:hypothetical protein
MLNDEQLLDELSSAADGLLFMSETDAPLEPLRSADEPTPDLLRRLSGVSVDTPVEAQVFDDFFRPAVSEPVWKSAHEIATARRFQRLVELLHANLTDLRVFRVGRINMEVYVLGRAASGNWLGLRTRVVET